MEIITGTKMFLSSMALSGLLLLPAAAMRPVCTLSPYNNSCADMRIPRLDTFCPRHNIHSSSVLPSSPEFSLPAPSLNEAEPESLPQPIRRNGFLCLDLTGKILQPDQLSLIATLPLNSLCLKDVRILRDNSKHALCREDLFLLKPLASSLNKLDLRGTGLAGDDINLLLQRGNFSQLFDVQYDPVPSAAGAASDASLKDLNSWYRESNVRFEGDFSGSLNGSLDLNGSQASTEDDPME